MKIQSVSRRSNAIDRQANNPSELPVAALVTGTLAVPALRQTARLLARQNLVDPVVVVLNIQVAALMSCDWVARKLTLPDRSNQRPITRIILPGYCRGDLKLIENKFGIKTERGPVDLHDLPLWLDPQRSIQPSPEQPVGELIQIIAEINDAPRLSRRQLMIQAKSYAQAGADVIDIGCDPYVPGSRRPVWKQVGDAVKTVRDLGLRVSVDTFDPREASKAVRAGAELVLSVNSTNVKAAADWGAEVVAIPDTPSDMASLDRTIDQLENYGVKYRLDPILEPIGLGFAVSLGRYLQARKRYPRAAMMMGVGNLTELTAADSAGINALLLGICAELNISSVLTTQVASWTQTSVREVDAARRLMQRAVLSAVPPKRLDHSLVMLRDPRNRILVTKQLRTLAAKLTDPNIRLFACQGRLHAMNRDFHIWGDDPFTMFERMNIQDASHAFYLGYELAKAMTAMTLGKNYTQDQALRWGLLSRDEASHYDGRKRADKVSKLLPE